MRKSLASLILALFFVGGCAGKPKPVVADFTGTWWGTYPSGGRSNFITLKTVQPHILDAAGKPKEVDSSFSVNFVLEADGKIPPVAGSCQAHAKGDQMSMEIRPARPQRRYNTPLVIAVESKMITVKDRETMRKLLEKHREIEKRKNPDKSAVVDIPPVLQTLETDIIVWEILRPKQQVRRHLTMIKL